MYKEFISQVERIDTLFIAIIGLIGWVFFLLTYIFRRRNMQNILNRLEKELKEHDDKIRDLELQLDDTQKSKTNLETEIKTLKTYHTDLTSTIEGAATEVDIKVESFEKEWLFIEYESNYFAKEKGMKKGEFNTEVVYKIILKTENEGTFELVNEDNDDYILNKDLYLLPGLCSFKYSDNSTRKKIGSIIPGKVHLDADKWIVDKKVQIEIL